MLGAMLAALLASQYQLRWASQEFTLDLAEPSTFCCPLEVVNRTNQPLEIWAGGFWPNHKLTLVTAKGGTVPLTKLGKQGAARFESSARDKNFPILVAARGSYRYRTPPLPDFFELSPGDYSITVAYSEKWTGIPLKLATGAARLRIIKSRARATSGSDELPAAGRPE